MTEEQKQQITALRKSLVGYKKIAKTLGIGLVAVKSYCRYHHLQEKDLFPLSGLCRYCKKPLENIPRRKPKKYCSDVCRMAWWSEHRDELNRRVIYHHRCLQCGIEFENGAKKSRFCSRKCYAAFRRKEPGWYVAEGRQYAEGVGGQPGERSEEATRKGDDPEAARGGAEFLHLPASCQCGSCPWFYNGKRCCQNDGLPAQALPSAHRQSE